MKESQIIIMIGIVIILVGVLWQFGIKFGRLPGDIIIDQGNFKLYFPFATSVILSIIAALVFFIVRIFQKS